MKKKNRRCVLLAIALMFSLNIGSSNALAYKENPSDYEVVSEKISSMEEVLYVRDNVVYLEKNINNIDENISLSVGGVESKSKEIMFFVPSDEHTPDDVVHEITQKLSVTPQYSLMGGKWDNDTDSTYSIRGTITIYWDTMTCNGCDYIKLTKVQGEYEQLDRQVHVVSQYIVAGCCGWATGGYVDQKPRLFGTCGGSAENI